MGLAYLFFVMMIAGAAVIGVALLIWSRNIWKKPRFKFLAVIPLILAGFCFAFALYFLYIFFREPPWRFRF